MRVGDCARDQTLRRRRDAPPATGEGARLADAVWTAKADPESEVAPRSVSGLAWADPVAGAARGGQRLTEHAGLRDVLSWRWIDAEGRGELDHRRRELRLRGGRMDGGVDRAASASVSIGMSPQSSSAALAHARAAHPVRGRSGRLAGAWHVVGEEGGPAFPARAATARELSSLGVPGVGPGRLLDLSRLPPRERLLLHARAERAWGGERTTPLLLLPRSYAFKGNVFVSADPTWLLSVESRGTRSMDGALTRHFYTQLVRGDIDDGSGASRDARAAVALGYDGGAASVRLATEPLKPVEAGGVIEEAVLTTSGGAGGAAAHRLTVRVAAAGAESLGVTLPAGAVLEAATSWGEPLSPGQRPELR